MFRLFCVIAAALCFAATSSAQTVEHTFRFNAGNVPLPGAYYGQQQFPQFDPGTCGGGVPVGSLPVRSFAPMYSTGFDPVFLPQRAFFPVRSFGPVYGVGYGPAFLPNRFRGVVRFNNVGARGRFRFAGGF